MGAVVVYHLVWKHNIKYRQDPPIVCKTHRGKIFDLKILVPYYMYEFQYRFPPPIVYYMVSCSPLHINGMPWAASNYVNGVSLTGDCDDKNNHKMYKDNWPFIFGRFHLKL